MIMQNCSRGKSFFVQPKTVWIRILEASRANSPILLARKLCPQNSFPFLEKHDCKNSASKCVHFDTWWRFYMVIDHLEIDRTYLRLLFLVPVLTAEQGEAESITHQWPYLAKAGLSPLLLSFILIEPWHRPDVISMLKLHCFHNKVSLHHS